MVKEGEQTFHRRLWPTASYYNARPMASAIVLAAIALSCLLAGAGADLTLTILHTGDLAAQTVAVDNYDNPCTLLYNATASKYVYTGAAPPCIGGMPRLKTLLDSLRANATHPTLLIDVGNMFQSDYDTGSLILIKYMAEGVFHYMAPMRYDAVHFNYREYIMGFGPLAEFVRNMTLAGTDVVEANLNWQTQVEFLGLTIPTFVVYTYNGTDGDTVKVGYTATITDTLTTKLSFPENTSATNEVEGLRKAVGTMVNMGVNKIIVSISSQYVLNDGTRPLSLHRYWFGRLAP